MYQEKQLFLLSSSFDKQNRFCYLIQGELLYGDLEMSGNLTAVGDLSGKNQTVVDITFEAAATFSKLAVAS